MKRLALLVGLVLLALVGTTTTSQAYYLDTPHNESNGIVCYTCHGMEGLTPATGETWTWADRALVDPEDTAHNYICNACHSKTPKPGLPKGPEKVMHSKTTTGSTKPYWTTECVQCHDVHYQGQLDYSADDYAKLYLVTGTFTSNATYSNPTPLVSGSDSTSINFTTTTVQAGFEDTSKWKSKGGATSGSANMDAARALDGSRGLILVPDKTFHPETFEIINVTGNTIKVKGQMVRDAITNGNFAIIYGQSIKSSVMPNGGLVANDLRDVKYFVPSVIPASYGGYVDLSTATGTTKPLGLCQVCHDSTAVWGPSGTPPAHKLDTGNVVPDCDKCHKIGTGFSPSTDHSKFIGDRLTGTACLSCHTTFSAPESAHSGSCGTCHTSAPPAINSNNMPNEGTAPGPTVYNAIVNGGYSFASGRLKDASGNLISSLTFLKIDCGECHETKRAKLATVPATHPTGHKADFTKTPTCTTGCHLNASVWNNDMHTCAMCHAGGVTNKTTITSGPIANGVDGDARMAFGASATALTWANFDCLSCHTKGTTIPVGAPTGGGTVNAITPNGIGGIHHNNKTNGVLTTCATSTCHSKIGHANTVKTDARCSSCHDNGVAVSNARDAKTAPFVGTAALPEVHYANGGCSACHVIGASPGYEGALKTGTVATLSYGTPSTLTYVTGTDGGGMCGDCHGATYFASHKNAATIHATSVTNSCSACHTTTALTPLNSAARKATTSPYVATGEIHGTLGCACCHDLTTGLLKVSSATVVPKAPGQNSATFNGGSCNACHVAGTTTWTTSHTGPTLINHTSRVTNIPACQKCHTNPQPTGSTARKAITIPYSATGTGEVHSNLGCATCHDTTSGAKLTTFANGHAQANVAGDCTKCHTLTWDAMHTPATVNHATSKVTATTTCTACHTTAITSPYIGAKQHPNCLTCHNADGSNRTGVFSKADQVPVGGGSCATCHTFTSTWVTSHDHALGIDHSQEVANQTECTSCHSATGGFVAGQIASLIDGVTGNKVHNACLDCHNADGSHKTVTPRGNSVPAPVGGGACNVCHGTNYFDTHLHGSDITKHKVIYNPAVGVDTAQAAGTGCAVCHNDAGNSLANWTAINTEHAKTANSTAISPCSVCHSYTVDRTGAVGTPPVGSVNTALANHLTNTTCVGCHVPKKAPATHGGHAADFAKTLTCTTGCHLNASVWNNDMHTCAMCHAGGVTNKTTITSGPIANGVDGDARMAFGASATALTWANFDCLSCHTKGTTIPVGAPTGGGTANAITPNGIGGIHHDNKTSGVQTTCATSTCHSKIGHANTVKTDARCSSCHDNGVAVSNARDAKTAPFVGTAALPEVHYANGGCSACHVIGASPGYEGALKTGTVATLSYGTPSTLTYVTGTDGGGMCGDCHGATYFASHKNAATIHATTVTNPASSCSLCHTNVTVGLARKATTTPYMATGEIHAAGCVTCHDLTTGLLKVSSATLVPKAPGQNSATFNGGSCVACHVTATSTFSTIHTLPVTTGTATVSHASKVSVDTNCTTCHTTTTPGISTLAKDAVTSPYIGTGEAHATSGCVTCHDVATGGVKAPYGRAILISNGGLGGSCSTCHVNATTNWAARHSASVAITTEEHVDFGPTTASCLPCHGNPTPSTSNGRSAGVVPYIVAGNVHATGCALCHNTTTGAKIVGVNGKGSATVAAVGGKWACADCHTMLWEPAHTARAGVNHTDRASLGTTTCGVCHTNTAGGPAGLMPIDPLDNKVHDACSVCHNTTTGGLKAGNTVNGLLPIAKGYCNTCHGGTYFSNTATSKHSSTHTVTVGSDTSGGAACYTCHSADTGAAPGNTWTSILARHDKSTTTADPCDVCHSATRVANANAAVVADRALTVQAIIAKYSPTTTQVTCLMCHDKSGSHGGHSTTDFKWQALTGSTPTCGNAACHNAVANPDVIVNVHGGKCTLCHKTSAGGDGSTIIGVENNGDATKGDLVAPHVTLCTGCHLVAGSILVGGIHHDTATAASTDTAVKSCVTCHRADAATITDLTHLLPNHSTRVATYTGPGSATAPNSCMTALCHTAANVIGTLTGIPVSKTVAGVHSACTTCHTFNATTLAGMLRTAPLTKGVNAMPANGGSCIVCHNGYITSTPSTYLLGNGVHHGNANAASGACEHCHNDPRQAAPNTGFTHPAAYATQTPNVPTHLLCEECHLQPKAATSVNAITNTRTNGWTATAGNMTIYAFDKGTETKKTATTWKTAPVRTVVHTIPNTAAKINNYGICLGCHNGSNTLKAVLAPKVVPQHAMPTTINATENYCGATTTTFGYAAFLPGRGVYNNVSNIALFADLFRTTADEPDKNVAVNQYHTAWGTTQCGNKGGTKDYKKVTRALGLTFESATAPGMPTTAATLTAKGMMTIPNPWALTNTTFSNPKYGAYTGFINQMPVFAAQTFAADATKSATMDVVSITSAIWNGTNLTVVASVTNATNCSELTLQNGAGNIAFTAGTNMTACTVSRAYAYPTNGVSVSVVSSQAGALNAYNFPITDSAVAGAAPTMSISAPNGLTGQSLTAPTAITYTLADTDSVVTGSFSLDTDTNSANGIGTAITCTGGTGGTTSIEGAGLTCTWNGTNSGAVAGGTYYVHGQTTDGTTTVHAYSGSITFAGVANAAPTMSISAPNGLTGQTLATPTAITYTLADTDSVVTGSFSLDTDTNATNGIGTAITCTGGTGGTTSIEGTNLTCTWNGTNSGAVAGGTYYVHGQTTDGTTTVESYSGSITFAGVANAAPTMSISAPNGLTGQTLATPTAITYTLADTDSVVTGSFSLDTDTNATNGIGTAITCTGGTGGTTSIEGTNLTCTWNGTNSGAVAGGTYYVHGQTTDGTTTVHAYSGSITFAAAAPVNVTYWVAPGTATSTGTADGNTTWTQDQPTGAMPVKVMLGTTQSANAWSYRLITTTLNTAVVGAKMYSDIYAASKTITAASGAAYSVRVNNTTDTVTFHIYAYNPSGTAGNKRLLLSSNAVAVGTAGANVTVNPTYTGSGTINAGERLMIEYAVTQIGATTGSARIYNQPSTVTVTQQ